MYTSKGGKIRAVEITINQKIYFTTILQEIVVRTISFVLVVHTTFSKIIHQIEPNNNEVLKISFLVFKTNNHLYF